MVKEEEKLEIKANMLMKRIGELEKSLENKKAQIELLQEEILQQEKTVCQDEIITPREPENYAGEPEPQEPENYAGEPVLQGLEKPEEKEALREAPNDGKEQECVLLQVIRDFCAIAEMIIKNADYVEYTYATKYSVSFYKVEQEVFDAYVRKYSKMDLKAFLKSCVDLMILKSEPNRQYSYYTGKRRVYYVSRNFMNCAAQKADAGETGGNND